MYVGSSYIIRVMLQSRGGISQYTRWQNLRFLVLPARAIQAFTQISFFHLWWKVQVNQYPICNFFGDLTVYQSGSNDSIHQTSLGCILTWTAGFSFPAWTQYCFSKKKGETQQWVRLLYLNHFKLLVYFSFTINT